MFKPFSIRGVGVHSGLDATVSVRPGEPNTGIVFYTPEGAVEAIAKNLKVGAMRCTTLAKAGAAVRTVEHFLAAVAFLDVRDLRVELSAKEMPILDGSAAIWYRRFIESGAAPAVRLQAVCSGRSGEPDDDPFGSPLTVTSGKSIAEILPVEREADAFIEVEVDMSAIARPTESHRFTFARDSFEEISSARTYAFAHEIETLRKTGLAEGGGLHNALVIGPSGPINPEGLRFPNEPSRHKILDAVGDLFLLGGLPRAQIRMTRPGHHLNHAVIRRIHTVQ